MEETKQVDKKSMVMEGMYRGMTGKLDEVRRTVSKELQFTSAQQVSAYEALAGTFKDGLETLLAEFRYLSQQNSAVYDYNRKEREAVRDAVLEAVRAGTEQCVQQLSDRAAAAEEKLAAAVEEMKASFSAQLEELANKLEALAAAAPAPAKAEAPAQPAPEEGAPAEEAAAEEGYAEDTFDYDVLAEKIASILPETDYDMIADKVVAALPPVDGDAIADKVAAAVPPADENSIADKVAESIPLIDYDLIAERVASVMEGEFDVTVDETGLDKIADAVLSRLDYEKLAELVAGQIKPTVVYAAAPAEAAPVKGEPVAEEAPAEEPAPAAPVEAEPAAAEAPAEVPAEAPAGPAEEELAAAAAPVQRKLVVEAQPAPKPAPKPVVVPVPDDPGKFTRFKRSFKAKIIESDEEVKGFYFDLKNAFLSYSRISSQVSWSNDRYTFAGDTIAKVGVRGRTLCVYLALNPDEFPSSVYHQRFAGDTKMYEKTPMMVKVKSGVALKRAIRLVEMLMENLGAVKDDDRVPVDYSEEFAFRSEEQLLAEGLIKTAIVEKSDMDF